MVETGLTALPFSGRWLAYLAFAILAWPAPAGAAIAHPDPLVESASEQHAYLFATEAKPLINGAAHETLPELFFNGDGHLVVSYLNASRPYFATLNQTSGDVLVGPVLVSSEIQYDCCGPSDLYLQQYAAASNSGRLARIYANTSDRSALLAVYEANGSEAFAPLAIGSISPSLIGSMAVTMGANDSVVIVRSVRPNSSLPARDIVYSRVSSNGSVLESNVTLFSDGDRNYAPRLISDPLRDRHFVAWRNDSGLHRILAFDESGAALWGPVDLGARPDDFSFLVLPDGAIIAIWAYQAAGDLRYSRISSAGALSVSNQSLLSGLVQPSQPHALLAPNGEMALVWIEFGTSSRDVRLSSLNATTLQEVRSSIWVSHDDQDSVEPRAAFSPEGWLAVGWVNNTSFAGNGDIMLARAEFRSAALSLDSEETEISIARGEKTTVRINVANNGSYTTCYEVDYSLTAVSPPLNWSVQAEDELGGPFPPSICLEVGNRAGVAIDVVPPIADPAGYQAVLSFTAVDSQWSAASSRITVGMTVIEGHRIDLSPASSNATVLPGTNGSLALAISNTGNFTEANVSVLTSSAVPPGWALAILPALVELHPGQVIDFIVDVAVPADASTVDVYCGLLEARTESDPFARAAARFCVTPALVSQPSLLPLAVFLPLDPGAVSYFDWTLKNGGNAGAPMDCSLGLAYPLPPGWYSFGVPALFGLRGNESETARVGFLASPNATGGFSFDSTIVGSCDGAQNNTTATARLVVLEKHQVGWRVPGNSTDASAEGLAVFTVEVQNLGNVHETFAQERIILPLGWSVSAALSVEGLGATSLPPYGSGVIRVVVESAAEAISGLYGSLIRLSFGNLTPLDFGFTVRILPHYGVSVGFSSAGFVAGASVTLNVSGAINNTGNANDTYAIYVSVTDAQLWSPQLSFLPSGNGPASLLGSLLFLGPGVSGTLVVSLRTPREPTVGNYTVTISVMSVHGPATAFYLSVRIVLPDYRVRLLELPGESQQPGVPGNLTIEFYNAGEAPGLAAPARVVVDGITVWEETIDPLPPHGAQTVHVALSLEAGAHEVVVISDPTDSSGANPLWGYMFESDEGNNRETALFSIEAAAGEEGHGGDTRPAGIDAGMVTLVVAAAATAVGSLAAVMLWRRRVGE